MMNDFGATALSCAAKYGHPHISQLLIDHGALVNAVGVLAPNKKGDGNRTALMWAALHGHLACVQVMLRNKADPNMRDANGQTAAQLAKLENVICELKK
ncbi:unnamed protein product [Sphagnum balticum]